MKCIGIAAVGAAGGATVGGVLGFLGLGPVGAIGGGIIVVVGSGVLLGGLCNTLDAVGLRHCHSYCNHNATVTP